MEVVLVEDVIVCLQDQGYMLLEVVFVDVLGGGSGLVVLFVCGLFLGDQLVQFIYQLVILFGVGQLFDCVFGILLELFEGEWVKKLIECVCDCVCGGIMLLQVLDEEYGVFFKLYILLVCVGEVGGLLEEML